LVCARADDGGCGGGGGAGSLKRANPTLHEDVVLIRALRDSNVPKFLKDDLSLFQAIIRDLFPGVKIPQQDFGELQECIEEAMRRRHLQVVPEFVLKVIQFYDTMNVRFGCMLVGQTGGGKSSILHVLADSLGILRSERRAGHPRYQKVQINVLNPKVRLAPLLTVWCGCLCAERGGAVCEHGRPVRRIQPQHARVDARARIVLCAQEQRRHQRRPQVGRV
jgi:hypothetical protein